MIVASGDLAARPLHPAPIAIVNAEDIAPIDTEQAVVSSMAGGPRISGALFLANGASGTAQTLFPDPAITVRPTTPDCNEPVAADQFKPHGIALSPETGDSLRLYVVNHGARESIEMFRLDMTPHPRLTWTGCAIFPEGAFGNAVAIARNGDFFATNQGRPMGGGKAVHAMGSEILSWRAGHGWAAVGRSAVAGGNGLLLSPDEKTLFFAGWANRTVVSVPLDQTEPVRSVPLAFMPDNLRWSATGTILAAGHFGTLDAVVACFISASAVCNIPSGLAEIEPDTLTQVCVRPVNLGLATSAVAMGRDLWIGSARNSHVERVAAPAC